MISLNYLESYAQFSIPMNGRTLHESYKGDIGDYPLFSMLSLTFQHNYKLKYEGQVVFSTNASSAGGNKGLLVLTTSSLEFVSASILGRRETSIVSLDKITSIKIQSSQVSIANLLVHVRNDFNESIPNRLFTVQVSSLSKAKILDDIINFQIGFYKGMLGSQPPIKIDPSTQIDQPNNKCQRSKITTLSTEDYSATQYTADYRFLTAPTKIHWMKIGSYHVLAKAEKSEKWGYDFLKIFACFYVKDYGAYDEDFYPEIYFPNSVYRYNEDMPLQNSNEFTYDSLNDTDTSTIKKYIFERCSLQKYWTQDIAMPF